MRRLRLGVKTWWLGAMVRGLAVSLPASMSAASESPPLPPGLYAEIATAHGVIVAELNSREAPLTVTNFVGLAEGTLGPRRGAPFFDKLKFHRVVAGFVVQGGDPLGSGEGGPGYEFADEFSPGLGHGSAGVLSMANTGPDTNGSQFFITLAPAARLDFLHSVFGRVVRGLDVLPQLELGDAMQVKIRREGDAARAFRADQATFAQRAAAATKFAGPREPGPDAFIDDPDRLLPAEPPRARGFNFKLANHARATGIKVFVRVLARIPAEAEGKKFSSYARALATRLGAGGRCAVVFHAADRNEWRLWFGDELLPKVMGRAGTVEDFMRDGALHERKEALLAGAKRVMAESKEAASQRLKIACDAVLESVFAALAPAVETRKAE